MCTSCYLADLQAAWRDLSWTVFRVTSCILRLCRIGNGTGSQPSALLDFVALLSCKSLAWDTVKTFRLLASLAGLVRMISTYTLSRGCKQTAEAGSQLTLELKCLFVVVGGFGCWFDLT